MKLFFRYTLCITIYVIAPNQPQGKLISIDLLPMHSVEGATVISPADFTSTDTQNKVTDLLNGCHVDVILSDMVNLQYLTFVESVN